PLTGGHGRVPCLHWQLTQRRASIVSEALIQARGVGVRRNGRYLVKNAELTLEEGKILTLIGPNGAGKTKLVRSILGLIRSDEGSRERRLYLRIGDMPQKSHREAT